MSDRNAQPPIKKTLPETALWVEMLASMGEKHARLSQVAGGRPGTGHGRSGPSGRRTSILQEIEKERARIARELHAGAGQPLAGIKVNLELLEEWSQTMPEAAREALGRLNRLAEAALGQVRAVSHRLHPPEWQELSLGEALRLLVDESGIRSKCAAVLLLGPLPAEPPHAAKVVLYRCAQECISNVLRHSEASEFGLELSEAGGLIRMSIHDNGCGIPDNARKSGGIGLASIREHTISAGGVLRISSGTDGTVIDISLPLSEE